MINNISFQASILFVDDEKDILEILAFTFSRYFQRVYTASSFDEAVQILALHHVDCVITDFMMPGKNGLDLVSFVHKRYPKVPLIILTGNADNVKIEEKLEYGIFDLIEKPLNMQLILNRICNALLQASSEDLINEFIKFNFPELIDKDSKYLNLFDRLDRTQKIRSLCLTRLLNLNSRKVSNG